jgi:ubiquinone biosynthesis protein UbiJ
VGTYRTPLPALLAAFLETAINRFLALDPGAPTRLERLEGRLLQVDLQGLGITLFLAFEYGAVLVSLEAEREPDTTVQGTPAALFMMAAPEEVADWGVPGSGVIISGNANLARDLGKIFSQIEPDWESPLSELLGETLGFQVASGLRRGADTLRDVARGSADQAVAYLRDESGLLVSRGELGGFIDGVDRLRDAVARLETRLRHIEDAAAQTAEGSSEHGAEDHTGGGAGDGAGDSPGDADA